MIGNSAIVIDRPIWLAPPRLREIGNTLFEVFFFFVCETAIIVSDVVLRIFLNYLCVLTDGDVVVARFVSLKTVFDELVRLRGGVSRAHREATYDQRQSRSHRYTFNSSRFCHLGEKFQDSHFICTRAGLVKIDMSGIWHKPEFLRRSRSLKQHPRVSRPRT